MKELNNYCGEFDPSLRLEDFSKETLVKLLGVYAKLYQAVDGFWYLSVKDRVNNEEAIACDLWVWEKQIPYEMARLCKVMRIERNGVVSAMKALQVAPCSFTYRLGIEVKDENNAVLTVRYCPTLEALEKEGKGREQSICRQVDVAAKQKFAKFFAPSMEVVPLKLPPRKNKDEVCCQWEFKLT